MFEALRGQIFVGVLEYLDHRRVDTCAEALDLFPGKKTVVRNLVHMLGDARLADLDQVFRSAQLTRRGAAYLDMCLFPDRLQLEHGVEGRNFQNADIRHVEQLGDVTDRRLADPAVILLLGAPQERDHRGGLPARRIPVDQLLRPRKIVFRELEAVWLFRGKSANCHGVIPVLKS